MLTRGSVFHEEMTRPSVRNPSQLRQHAAGRNLAEVKIGRPVASEGNRKVSCCLRATTTVQGGCVHVRAGLSIAWVVPLRRKQLQATLQEVPQRAVRSTLTGLYPRHLTQLHLVTDDALEQKSKLRQTNLIDVPVQGFQAIGTSEYVRPINWGIQV